MKDYILVGGTLIGVVGFIAWAVVGAIKIEDRAEAAVREYRAAYAANFDRMVTECKRAGYAEAHCVIAADDAARRLGASRQ